jgi:N-acetylglucosamine-6-phosphate deacetylase
LFHRSIGLKENMSIIIHHGSIVTPNKTIKDGYVFVNDAGIISQIGERLPVGTQASQTIDLQGNTLIPGLVDIHLHGGCGVNFEKDYQPEAVAPLNNHLAAQATTAYLRTFCAAAKPELEALLVAHVESLKVESSGARCFGFHLEGPFLSLQKRGAFNPQWLHSPELSEVRAYIASGQGYIRQVTLAPELDNAFETAAYLNQVGVVAAFGHTNASFELAIEALNGNFRHVTHVFNAMSSFNHRNPGAVGAVLLSKMVTAELIADFVHVHPQAIQLLINSIGLQRIVLITDAMAAAGMQDGVYDLAGQSVHVCDHTARLEDGTLAGSVATLLECVQNMVCKVGVSLREAVNMASINPARAMHLAHITGSIEVNKSADVVILDQDLSPVQTLVKGKVVYSRESSTLNN